MTYKLYDLKKLLFYMLFCFPCLPIKVTNCIFIFYAFLVLVIFIKEKHGIQFKALMSFGILSLLFVPYLIELLLHPDNPVMQFETEKKTLFFIAPFIFYADSRLQFKTDLSYAFAVFICTVSVLSAVSLVYLSCTGDLFLKMDASSRAFQLRTSFENFTGLHPTYYGLFSTTATLWIISMYKNYTKAFKTLFVFFLIVLIGLNVLIASKMALIILIIGLVALVYRETKHELITLFICMGIVFVCILLAVYIPSLNSRLSEIPAFFSQQTFENTVVERLTIFNCSKALFLSKFLTGIGAANAQVVLDISYVWVGFNKGAIQHLNSHNQYLTLGINYGIGIVLFFVAALIFLILKSKRSILTYIYYLSLILIMLSESILERQMGIYYFLFFALLFLSANNTIEKREEALKTGTDQNVQAHKRT